MACAATGKRRFANLDAAQQALDSAEFWRARGDEKRQEKRAYECKQCGGWHLTSLERPKLRQVPIKPVSAKRAREQRQRSKMLTVEFGTNPACARCGKPADDAHELLSRARGGSITDRKNVAPVCRACHTWITTNPTAAEAEGFALPTPPSAERGA